MRDKGVSQSRSALSRRGLWLIVIFFGLFTGPIFAGSVESIASGDGHYLALSDKGALESWGRNDFGQLGQGTVQSGWGGPTCPAMVLPPGKQWLKVAAGDNHSLAIASDGTLWAWGRNDLGQLGFTSMRAILGIASGKREPEPVQISSDHDWIGVSGGMLSSFALKRDGSLWGFGGNWMGQLGDGESRPLIEFSSPVEKLPHLTRPTRIGKEADWAAIAAGAEHVLARKLDGSLWAWGRNDCGQLGVGTFISTNRPTRVGRDNDWVAFSAGGVGWRGARSAAIKRDGSLWVWGNWKAIQLAKGIANPADTNLFSRPVRLGLDSDWVRVVCGNDLCVALKSEGTLWVWGAGATNLAGLVMPAPRAPVAQIGSDRDWINVVADGHGLGSETILHALKTAGTVWSWSPNIYPASGGVPAIPTGVQVTPRQILPLGKPIPRPTVPTHAENGSR